MASITSQIGGLLRRVVADAIYEALGAVGIHSALGTGIHGVGASTVASASSVATAVSDHSVLTTGVHGVGGSTVLSAADAAAAYSPLTHAHWIDFPTKCQYLNVKNGATQYPANTNANYWWGVAGVSPYNVRLISPEASVLYGFSVTHASKANLGVTTVTYSIFIDGAEQVATRLAFADADAGTAFKSWVPAGGAEIAVAANAVVEVRATCTGVDGFDRIWYNPTLRLKIGA